MLSANSRQDEAYRRADDARLAQLDLAALDEAMLEQQDGLRGYTETADDSFLAIYQRGRSVLPSIDHRLQRELLPEESVQLRQMEAAIAAWQDWAEGRRATIAASGAAPTLPQAGLDDSLFASFRSAEGALGQDGAKAPQRDVTTAFRRSQFQSLVLAVGAVVGMLLIGALAAMLVRSTLRPVTRLSRTATGLSAGEPSAVPYLDRDDEVGQLALALDRWRAAEAERGEIARAMVDVSEQVALGEVLERSAERLLSILRASEVVLSLIANGTTNVVCAKPHPFESSGSLPALSPGGRAMASRIANVGGLTGEEWDPAINSWRDRHGFGPFLAMPMVAVGEPIGVATVLRAAGSPPSISQTSIAPQ